MQSTVANLLTETSYLPCNPGPSISIISKGCESCEARDMIIEMSRTSHEVLVAKIREFFAKYMIL